MCGICGKIYFDRSAKVDEHLIRRMSDVLQYRGPDEGNVYINRHVGLGHRRLSIIDLTTGQQPMCNARQDIWIVFNGEIYNFLELRRELEQRGYNFSSHSDTEVIIHLYEEYGTSCVDYLRGMFAFAVWDQRRQRLFLARDRVGQKPLFYLLTSHSITFASEIKSILEDRSYKRAMNLAAMYDYLTYRYVPFPHTIFQDICKLPPAHILVWEKGTVKIERYWNLQYVPKTRMDEQEIREKTEELLQESVRLRMISDVPIGAFLSGGIDSSLVVAMMAQYSDHPVKTFSIGFREQVFNELPYARLVAKRYSTEHHEFIVEPDAIEILPKLIWHFDEPFGDSSAIPTYYVSKMTRQYVKVALNGDGGDETFGGYLRYLNYTLVKYYSTIPYTLRRNVFSPLLNMLSGTIMQRYFPACYDIIFRRVKYIHDLSLQSQQQLYARRVPISSNSLKLALLTDDVRKQFDSIDSLKFMFRYLEADNAKHFTDKMLYSDVMTYLPGDIMVKVDRMTMAHGIEGRSPFLDHILMEFVAKLPTHYKLQKNCLKVLLKAIAKTWLPGEILTRKKQGFRVPVGEWFRTELREMVYDIFSSSCLVQMGIFKKSAIEQILQEHQTGEVNHRDEIWTFLNLELWYRMFIQYA